MSTLTIELNVTKYCNMRCDYCTEADQYATNNCEDILPEYFNFIDKLIASDYFKQHYNGLCLTFWGGEPTTQPKVMLEIIDYYQEIPQIGFMVYTNGNFMPPELATRIESLKSIRTDYGSPKFFTQISYDGLPIHDLKRKTLHGERTSARVLKTITWAKTTGIPFSLKSTITMDTLKYLYEAYLDVSSVYQGSSYFPTLDVINLVDLDTLEENIHDLKENLKKIVVHMVHQKRKKLPQASFMWFANSKANCAAGVSSFIIDTDGSIYSCHGCLYSDLKKDHLVGNISDDISVLDIARQKLEGCLQESPEECASCPATFCARCNVIRYEHSSKESYQDRWKDYTDIPSVCRVHREIGIFSRAFQALTTETIQ